MPHQAMLRQTESHTRTFRKTEVSTAEHSKHLKYLRATQAI